MKTRLKTKIILGGALAVTLAVVAGSALHDYLMAGGVGAPWDFLLTLGPFLLILLLPFWLALQRWIFRPLERLNQANRQAAQGDVEAAVIPDAAIPDDEIGAVIRARNEALDALLQHQRRLEENIAARVRAEEQVRRRNEELAALNAIAATLSESLDVEALLEATLQQIVAFTGVDGAECHLTDDSDNLALAMTWGLDEAFVAASHDYRFSAGEGIPGRAFARREPLYVPDAPTDARYLRRDLAQDAGYRSLLCVPICGRESLLGTFMLYTRAAREFGAQEQALLMTAGRQLAVALERVRLVDDLRELNATLEARVRQRTFELQVLYELTQQIGYTLNYDQLFHLMLEHLHRAVSYDVAASLLATDGFCELFVQSARPLAPAVEQEVQTRLLAGFEKLSGQPVNRAEITVKAPAATGDDLSRPPLEWLRAFFQVPLIVRDATVGMLFVGSEQEREFNEDQIRLLYTVANQASESIQRLRALLAVEQQRLETLVERLPEGVLLLDAEKRIVLANPVGREYLALLADVRVGDVLTHLGGESLDVLLRPRAGGPALSEVEGLPHEITVEGRVFEAASQSVEAGPEAGGWVLTLRDVTWERELLAAEQTRRQELDALYGLARQLVATDEMQTVLGSVIRHAVESVHVTFGRILTLEEDGAFVCRAAYPARLLDCDMGVGRPAPAPAWPHYQRALSHGEPLALSQTEPALSAEERQALFLNPLASSDVVPEGVVPKFNSGTSTSSQEPALTQSLCLAPMHVGDEPIGILALGEVRSAAREPFDAGKLRLTAAIADQAASALHRARLHEQLETAYFETVLALARAMDARDTYTGDHSRRLSVWAEATARELGCTAEEVEAIQWGAMLHDIGKIGVPDEILRKPRELDEAEWEVIKRHPVIGAEIVAPVKRLAEVAPIIRAHQEKYDGSGYPDGLKGEEIPLGARILAVADAYGAIIDERPYKEARSHEEAVAELRRCAGTHFDPRVVEAFLRVLERDVDITGGGVRGAHWWWG